VIDNRSYLPTEAEWNYVSAGGDDQRAYPWSSPDAGSLVVDGMHASYDDGTDCFGDGLPGCALTDLVEVGTKPAGDGRWGHSELAGNVWKWMLDLDGPYESGCTDCANLTVGSFHSIRGGSFYNGFPSLRTGFRYSTSSPRYYNIGFRCARPR
jgi:formylglycine-generating enzyme